MSKSHINFMLSGWIEHVSGIDVDGLAWLESETG
jgi:hypothetical protein